MNIESNTWTSFLELNTMTDYVADMEYDKPA